MTHKFKNDSPATKKDTIYIDVEDDITSTIDKVVHSNHKIVAIVLPKRSAVFQSIVNMKLLKKAAQASKKNLVLVTSDSAVTPIAATVGMHIAKTSSSKPFIPVLTGAATHEEHLSSDDNSTDSSPEASTIATDDDVIELDNRDENTKVDISEKDPGTDKPTKKVKKKMKIPDFSSFRVRLSIGIAIVILLIVAWVFGFVILPKATITLTTDTSTVPINLQVDMRVGAETQVDVNSGILPAQRVQVEKIDTVSVPATGEKNIGEKAKGLMNLTNCIDDGQNKVIPAGTSFSSGDVTFVTTEAVQLDFAIFSGGNCLSSDFGRDKDVSVIATQPGPQANIGARSYNSSINGIRAFGSDMVGGTQNIVKVITDQDVATAKQQLSGTSKSEALNELKTQLETRDVRPVEESLTESEVKVDVSPAVGSEAAEVTVKVTLNYTMLGVAQEDLTTIIDNEIQKSIEDKEKNIRDNGLGSVRFVQVDQQNQSAQKFAIETVATIGPSIDENNIRESVVGKKRGEIERQLEEIDGVRSVQVDYSPAWITTTPKSTSKIEVVFIENDN